MRAALEPPPGLIGDDTSFASVGRWRDGSNVRFWLGRPQVIGGWERLSTGTVPGVCRNVFAWTDGDAALNVALGTHLALQVRRDELHDITPVLGRPAATLSEPFTVADGSATASLAHPGHGLDTGDVVLISGAVAIGGQTPGGAHAVTVVDEDRYTIALAGAAQLTGALGANPFSVVAGSAVVSVAHPAHGIASGARVTFAGAVAVGGLTPNGSFPITVADANAYSFTFRNAEGQPQTAGATATGGGAAVTIALEPTGGGPGVVVAPQRPFQAGSAHGAGGAGFGTGSWSTGDYGSPSEEDYFPRTWSFSALGQQLIANPRGGAVYLWKNQPGTPAEPVANAPRQVTCALAGPNDEIFALGCNEEVSGRFNPLCIRHSALRDVFGPNETVWRTAAGTTAREYVLNGGGRIVAGRVLGRYLLVWTNHALFLGQFVGQPDQVWRFDRVGQNCGLIGPNAVVTVAASAYWLGPDLQFRRYDLGGTSDILPCPIRRDMADNLSAVQGDKIVASSNSAYGEIRFDYPDRRDGEENSRYLAASVAALRVAPEQAWHRGRMRRTAMTDAGPSEHPVGVGPAYEPGEPISLEHDGGVSDVQAADQTLRMDTGPWVGRYLQTLRAGRLVAQFAGGVPPWIGLRRASPGLAKTSSGALVAFGPDTPRRTDRGLLIEPAATNLFVRSEPAVSDIGLGEGVSAASAPDNAPFAAAAWLALAARTVDDTYALEEAVLAPASRYRMSVFVAMADAGPPTLAGTAAEPGDFMFMAAGSLPAAADIGYERMSGAVWRVSATVTTPAAASNPWCGLYRHALSSGRGMVFTGLQIEAGEAASSYIATTTGPATRAADEAVAELTASVGYWHEKGASADGGPIAWHIETADQYVSEEQTATVLGVWPDFAGQVGPVTVEVTSRLKPQGDERTQGPLAMAPGEDKVDLRLSGRLFRVRLAGRSSPTSMRLGRLAVEYRPSGRR